MKRALVLLFAWLSLPAGAVLNVGEAAPVFATDASLGGTVYRYRLVDELKKGPVVLYFYPAAFTPGCTIEAHEFAEAIEKFKAHRATVIGISNDSIDTLKRFSVSECRGKFPVGADLDQSIMKAYDSVHPARAQYASRTSYVIAPDGKIVHVYSDPNPIKHVENALDAVRKLAKQGGK